MRFEPADRRVRVPPGTTLFAAAHWAGVAIDSTCGGRGTCGRCRVRCEREAPPIGAADRAHLTAAELAAGWRLACRTELAGPVVCRVPEPAAAPRAATSGFSRPVALEPDVRRVPLRLEPPSIEDPGSDLERLRAALAAAGHRPRIDLDALVELPGTLRRAGFAVDAVLAGDRLVALEPAGSATGLRGVAFDLGTTTVVGVLVDLATGEPLAVESAANRQARYGADVISRISSLREAGTRRGELQRAAIDTLNEILERLCDGAGAAPATVCEAVVAGNATMLHLLLGVDPGPIARAPFAPAFREPIEVEAGRLGLDIHPRGRLVTLPLIGAYVGADTVAGLHAVDLARDDRLRLFIDVGTNTEVALGSSRGLVATSAPAGPAFEGGRISCGMTATSGAVERVGLGERVELGVIGGGRPRGLCGSGLIDAAAGLRRCGLLAADGRLADRSEVGAHPLADRLEEIDGVRAFRLDAGLLLTQRDIRELQTAKGAVATAIEVLSGRLEVEVEDVHEVLLAGAFGSAIDPSAARDIGLVPAFPTGRTRFVGNTSVEGAKMALASFRERQMATQLARRVDSIELSADEDFNRRFLAHLAFPPLAEER